MAQDAPRRQGRPGRHLSIDVTNLAIAGIRRADPEGRTDIIRELVARRYGRGMATEVYGRAE
jgi:hypothetical protein